MSVITRQRVRYAETDQMGIVYYANYLVWFELGRVELLRSLGLAYSQMERDHKLILPVIEAGGRAVHVPYHVTWVHEQVTDYDAASFFEIAHMGLLPALLEELEKT